MSKFIYFIYYLRELDFKKLKKFLEFARRQSGRSSFGILNDAVISTFRYNISLLDFFYFKFYQIRHRKDRLTWAGTGYMYEYQKMMNPLKAREVLADKISFMKRLGSFTGRKFNTYDELIHSPQIVEEWIKLNRVVVKNSHGQVGREVDVVSSSDHTPASLLKLMKDNEFNLIEEFVVQHPDLQRLSPAALNTVRIITQEHHGKILVLAARLRISVSSNVDNLAAGNLAAPLDIATGKVIGPAIYSDITKTDEKDHPITGISILGFQLPFWNEAIQLVTKAALEVNENRSVGWDVAITSSGPILIEGNHNWCKLLWQLPVKKGLKQELEDFK